MKAGSQAFHVMAKPTGAICNLRCQYCFFLEKEGLYPGSRFRMDDETLESYIRQMMECQDAPEFAWQGGEPTLMGLDFFRKVVELQRKYQGPGAVRNTLQTNGTLLDEDWCIFLRENHFLVGISLDGPRDLHDAFRRDKQGRPTFDRVMQSIRMMQRHEVDFNVLCTIHAVNGDRPLEIYRFFRDEAGVQFLQLIPIVEWTGNQMSDRSVRPEQLGRFLIAVFDEWVRHDVGRTFVPLFDGVLASWIFGQSSLCIFRPTCGSALVLEHNGDLYSCDHYVGPKDLLGNILETPLAELALSDQQRQFGCRKGETLPQVCRECDFLFTCYGECPKNRLPGGLNALCAGYKAFFHHVARPMRIMAELIRRGQSADGVMRILAEEEVKTAWLNTGRNEPCPCGSGKKFKKCHGSPEGR